MTDKYGFGEAVGAVCFFLLIILTVGTPDLLDTIIRHVGQCK